MKNAKTQSFVPFGKRLATGLLRFSLVCCPVVGATYAQAGETNFVVQGITQTQTRVTGKVVDESGEVLIGVNVSVLKGTVGTVTDMN